MTSSIRYSNKGAVFLPFSVLLLGIMSAILISSYLHLLHARSLLSLASSDLLYKSRVIFTDLSHAQFSASSEGYNCLDTTCTKSKVFADASAVFIREDCATSRTAVAPTSDISGIWSGADCIEAHSTPERSFITRNNLKLSVLAIDIDSVLVAGQVSVDSLRSSSVGMFIIAGGEIEINEAFVPSGAVLTLVSSDSILVHTKTGGGNIRILQHQKNPLTDIAPQAALLVRAIRPVARRESGY